MFRAVRIRDHLGVGIFSSQVCTLVPQNPEVEWRSVGEASRASQSLSVRSDYIETSVFAKPEFAWLKLVAFSGEIDCHNSGNEVTIFVQVDINGARY